MKRRDFLKGVLAAPIVAAVPGKVISETAKETVELRVGRIEGVRFIESPPTTASEIMLDHSMDSYSYAAQMGRSAAKSMNEKIIEALRVRKGIYG